MTALPLVIEPQALHSAISRDNLLIIDLSSEENYQRAHIPGAVRDSAPLAVALRLLLMRL